MYWIDAYQLGRNAIVGLLVLSSLLMMYLGWRMHKEKKHLKRPNAKLAAASLALIALLVGVSAMPVGWNIGATKVDSLSMSDIMPVLDEGKARYQTRGTPIYTLTVTNNWIPRQYELPQAQACFYNSEKQAYQHAGVNWDVQEQRSDFGPNLNVIELGRGTETATLLLGSSPQIRPMPVEKPIDFEPQTYDTLYLFLNEDDRYDYIECFNLQPEQLQEAILIPVLP